MAEISGSNPADILVAALEKILHREHLFAKAHIEALGKVNTGACGGCTAEAALAGYRAAIKRQVEGRPSSAESIYCECCGGSIVECGCTWRDGVHDSRREAYCMKHAQWCPKSSPMRGPEEE